MRIFRLVKPLSSFSWLRLTTALSSPIGGYHEKDDLVLLLDVARFKYVQYLRVSVHVEVCLCVCTCLGVHVYVYTYVCACAREVMCDIFLFWATSP